MSSWGRRLGWYLLNLWRAFVRCLPSLLWVGFGAALAGVVFASWRHALSWEVQDTIDMVLVTVAGSFWPMLRAVTGGLRQDNLLGPVVAKVTASTGPRCLLLAMSVGAAVFAWRMGMRAVELYFDCGPDVKAIGMTMSIGDHDRTDACNTRGWVTPEDRIVARAPGNDTIGAGWSTLLAKGSSDRVVIRLRRAAPWTYSVLSSNDVQVARCSSPPGLVWPARRSYRLRLEGRSSASAKSAVLIARSADGAHVGVGFEAVDGCVAVDVDDPAPVRTLKVTDGCVAWQGGRPGFTAIVDVCSDAPFRPFEEVVTLHLKQSDPYGEVDVPAASD